MTGLARLGADVLAREGGAGRGGGAQGGDGEGSGHGAVQYTPAPPDRALARCYHAGMRSIRLALVLALGLAAASPAPASARAWKGITPGATTQAEVTEKFGEPTTKTRRGGKTILAYYGDQALEGTRQAQFHVDAQGVVVEITIFLTAQLDAETIEGTYGKPPQRTFVEDTFQKVWVYPAAGVTVYFSKEGNVEALSFSPGTRTPARAPAATEKEPAPPPHGAAAK